MTEPTLPPVPTSAPRDVHETAREALAQSIREAAGIGWSVHVAVPQIGPAVDAAYAAGVAAGRTAAVAAIRAEAAQLEERDGVVISYAYGFADAAALIDPPATRIAEETDR